LPARLLNVFAVPGDVFDEVKATAPSTANWLVPALLLVIVSWVGAWLIFSQPSVQQQMSELTDQAIQKQVERGKMPKEAADQARQIGQIMAKVTPFVAPVFVAFITPFGWGLILWLVGTQVLKGHFAFLKAVEVAGLASAISVLEAVVKALLVVSMGNLFASPTPALLVKDFDPQKPSHALLAVVNVMTFWLLAVRSAGLARLAGVPYARAAVWVFAIWAAYTSALLGLGLAAKTAFGQ
jgi:hypothetical protein